jgi:hypothetical protein
MDSFFALSFALQHKLNLCFQFFFEIIFFSLPARPKRGRKTKIVPFTDATQAVARANKNNMKHSQARGLLMKLSHYNVALKLILITSAVHCAEKENTTWKGTRLLQKF